MTHANSNLPEDDDEGRPGKMSMDDDARKLLAFEVAEDAKKQVTTWAKWMLAVGGLVLAILGIQFASVISGIDDKIEKAVDARVEAIIKDKTDEIDRRTQKMVDKQVELEVKTQTESFKAIEALKAEAQANLDTLKRETSLVLEEFEQSRKEVEQRKNIFITRLQDGSFSLTTTESSSYRTRSGSDSSILFGPIPPKVIGVYGAGPGEMLVERLIDGKYGSPFAHHFLRALQSPNADVDEDAQVSIQEAVHAARLMSGWSETRPLTPTIKGSDPNFSFLKFSGSQSKSAVDGEVHALLIGINEYDEPIRLRGCVNDARAFHSFLLSNDLAASSELLLDAEATGKRIKQSLSELVNKGTEEDVILVYYSGHLVQLPLDENGDSRATAIAPVDTQLENLYEQELLQVQQLCEMLDKSKAKQKIVLIP